MPALAQLKRFAGTRNGKLAIGGTAAGGVAALGLLRRRGAGGDPSAAGADAPPYGVATGTSGTNTDAFPNINEGAGIDVGQFEELVSGIGDLADALRDQGDTTAANPAPTAQVAPSTPVPHLPVAATPIKQQQQAATTTYVVKPGDTLTKIAQRYGLSSWKALYNNIPNRLTIGSNPNLIRPGQRLEIPVARK